MGILGITKGLIKTFEGVVEGDIEKIGKGVIKTAKGVATKILFTDDDDDDDDNDD